MSKEKEIEMLKEKLDYYTLVAADDEFDAGKVIKIVKRLEELEPTEAPKKSVDEFLDDFCKYCEEREREEKILVQEAVIAVSMMKKVWYYEKKKFANRSLLLFLEVNW